LNRKTNVWLQNLRKMALVIGREMYHHDKRQSAISGDIVEKRFERGESTRRGTNADDGGFWLLRLWFHGVETALR
jgi:hypothetical protein